VNVAGIPAISVPCGFTSEGLPIGMQIIGKHLNEASIIRAAYTYEKNTDFTGLKPEL
jgi:aspartyl-tRNA(Asn)/glutamyl-tRNA(Gln) amidotransferase subunit A